MRSGYVSIMAVILLFLVSFAGVLQDRTEGLPSRATVKTTYMVEMRDGVHLATDVHSPEEGGPRGSILVRTPYDRERSGLYAYFARQGWNGIAQDTRGRYDSEGTDDFPILWYAHVDGRDTVDWIANQSWSDGKVATYGGSALGVAQYRMAGMAPPNLTCQFITEAPPDMYHYSAYHGGEFMKMNLGELMIDSPYEERRAVYDNENFSLQFWGNLSLLDRWSLVNVPAIHAGGWFDPFCEGIIDGFMGYNYLGGPGARNRSKLVLGPWSHGDITYNRNYCDIDFPPGSDGGFTEDMFHDMLEQYMLNASNAFDDWPTVTYFLIGDADDPDAPGMEWKYSDVWPVPSNSTRLYFHQGGSLDPRSPLDDSVSISYLYDPSDPVPTIGGQNFGSNSGLKDQRPVENRNDVILFETPVLEEPLEVTGKITADLYVTSDRYDTDFTVKITDVYPDGRSILVTDGILRMRNRNGSDHWEFMEPGTTYRVTVDMFSTAYAWNAGHRIRVAVSSSNYPRFLANPNTRDGIYDNSGHLVANNTLFLDRSRPSSVILPVIGRYPNLPPIVVRIPDEESIEMDDMGELNLSVVVSDEDVGNLTYVWSVDSAEVSGVDAPFFLFHPSGDGDSVHSVNVSVIDADVPRKEVRVGWTVRVRNVHVPTEIVDVDPEGDVVLYEKENGSQIFRARFLDRDPYEDERTWSLDSGTVQQGGDEYLFRYDHSSSGKHVLEVESGDLYGSSRYRWNIEIIDVNRPPLISVLKGPMRDVSVNETDGGSLVWELDVTDPDGDAVEITWSLDGRMVGTGEGYAFLFDHDSAGTYRVTATASDGRGSSVFSVNVTVIDVNRAPRIVSGIPPEDIVSRDEEEDGSITFSVEVEDEDGDVIRISWFVDGVETASSESFTFEYGWNSSGSYAVSVVVSDGIDEVGRTWELHVIDVNRPPVIIDRSPSSSRMVVNDSMEFSVSAVDPDGDILVYTWRSNGAELSVNGGSFMLNRSLFGEMDSLILSVRVEDGRGGAASTSWNVEFVTDTPPVQSGNGTGSGEIPNEGKDEGGGAVFPIIAAVLTVLLIAAGLVFYIARRRKIGNTVEEGQESDDDISS